ncbi:MAG: trigger factor [Proteobacteria bacterium]|nr:trigger factor [Pseudomonadota bacterium]
MSLQVVDKSSEGLSRVIGVTVPAADLTTKLDAKIQEMAPQMRLKGFRPGKVPPAHVRRMFGRDLMREIVQDALKEGSEQALTSANLRAASSPELKMTSDVEKVAAGQEDLAFEIELEVMPDFTPVDVSSLQLTRPVYQPSEEDIEAELKTLAEQSRTYTDRAQGEPAQDGDQLTIDFVGRVGGETFEGGAAEDMELTLGSGRFIPGFEEQLVGAQVGETRTLSVTFPEQYQAAHLAGKAAEFETTVKAVRAPQEAAVDEALAERLGLGTLDALRDAIRKNLSDQYGAASRFKLKRALLDALDKAHDFPLPPRMVEQEFDSIWRQVKGELEQGSLSEEDQGKDEETLKAEYRRIAERRVRLGLVLAELGRAENVQVSDAELQNAIMAEARNYPGQERQVFDFYRQNPQASAQLRAPVYEEKVVELLFSKAQVTDQPVSKEALSADDDLPEGYGDAGEGAAGGDAGASASAPAETASDTGESAAPETQAAPAKKPRARKAKTEG